MQKIQGRQMRSFDQSKKAQKAGIVTAQKKDETKNAVNKSLPPKFAGSGNVDVVPAETADGNGKEDDGDDVDNDNGTQSDEEEDKEEEGSTQTKSLPILKGKARVGAGRRVVGKVKKQSGTAM